MKDDDRAVRMLKTALEMEEKGKRFYDGAIEKCSNKVGKDIFKMLAGDELVHMDRIKAIYESIKGGGRWSDDWKSREFGHDDLGVIFRQLAKKHGRDIKADTGDIEAVDVGLGFEEASVRFYEDHLKDAADPAEKEFIERMAVEERTHFSTLSDMKQYLMDPSSWFLEKERHGLDGA